MSHWIRIHTHNVDPDPDSGVKKILSFLQYFGSAWIRIDLAPLDPDPEPYRYWECGSGSRSKEINQNKQVNLISSLSKKLLYQRRYVLRPITLLKVYFLCKNFTFCDGKV